MMETIVASFAATNIDDIFILTLFYVTRKFRSSIVIAGQYRIRPGEYGSLCALCPAAASIHSKAFCLALKKRKVS